MYKRGKAVAKMSKVADSNCENVRIGLNWGQISRVKTLPLPPEVERQRPRPSLHEVGSLLGVAADYQRGYGSSNNLSGSVTIRHLEQCSKSEVIHVQRTEWNTRYWLRVGVVLLLAASLSVGIAVWVGYSGGEEEESLSVEAEIEIDETPLPSVITGITTRLDTINAIDILQQVPLVDGHNDWPWNLRVFVRNNLAKVDLTKLRQTEQWSQSPWSHTDIPSLRQGHVGAQFWAAFVPCEAQHLNAVQLTLEQIDVIKRFTNKYPQHFKFVTSAKGIEEAFTEGRIASLIGVEGGHSMGNSLAVLRIMYELGVRYLTLTHNCHTLWADSHIADREQQPLHNGLTEFGKSVVKEMNRLGMLIDLAHVSTATMEAALDTSRAPVIFSHSSAYTVCNSTRNVQDHILQRVMQNRGIVMVTFFSPFVSCGDTAHISQVADHIDYIRRVAGVDHVGFGGDFDGINRVPKGLEDVSKYPDLIAELAARGWTSEELKKVAGLNIIRVLKETEQLRDQLTAAGITPLEDLMPPQYLEELSNCTYDFTV